VYAKVRCAPLRIKKALGIFRELITIITRTTTRVAVRDPPTGFKNDVFGVVIVPNPLRQFTRFGCNVIYDTFEAVAGGANFLSSLVRWPSLF